MTAADSLSHIRWLYRFHTWARPRLVASAEQASSESLHRPGMVAGGNEGGSLYGTLLHLVTTEALWTTRWQGEARAKRQGAADLPDLDAMGRLWETLESDRARFLESLRPEDMERPLEYYSGQLGRMEAFPLWQTLLHVSNHMTHHRAEACAALTSLGVSPQSVDMLDFMRAEG